VTRKRGPKPGAKRACDPDGGGCGIGSMSTVIALPQGLDL
jgi:hypothetical protein